MRRIWNELVVGNELVGNELVVVVELAVSMMYVKVGPRARV